MRRKKYGTILLTLLVISGLAGTPTNHSLTLPERKLLISNLKIGKLACARLAADLSEKQLDFVPAGGNTSIRHLLRDLALSEKQLQDNMEAWMSRKADPSCRFEKKISDQLLLATGNELSGLQLNFSKTNEKEAIRANWPKEFNRHRSSLIRYVRSSTEDFRGRVASHPRFGELDCYQWLLYQSVQTHCILARIKEIRNQPGFPQE